MKNKTKRIAIIQGHPDQENQHYCHAIENAYKQGATDVGHIVLTVNAASLSVATLLELCIELNEAEPPATPSSLFFYPHVFLPIAL